VVAAAVGAGAVLLCRAELVPATGDALAVGDALALADAVTEWVEASVLDAGATEGAEALTLLWADEQPAVNATVADNSSTSRRFVDTRSAAFR